MARSSSKSNGNGRSNGRASAKANGKLERQSMQGAYDAYKQFEGRRYTGMKVGRGHKWDYEPGEWTEKKLTPDKWEFRYAVTKRRRGRAPEGSGVPVGTQYHWYILAHQTVTKLDANAYTTDMAGVKYKLSHRRADKQAWSASDRAQRKRLLAILNQLSSEIELELAEEPAKPARARRASAKPKSARPAAAKRAKPRRAPESALQT
jgi:hypothetical protein